LDITLAMDNVQIRDCNGTGVKSQASLGYVAASLQNVRVQTCAVGLEAGQRTRDNVNDSVFTRNPVGLKATGTASVLNVANTFVAVSQTVGVIGSAPSIIRLSSCTITQNLLGVDANGGQIISLDQNTLFGNATDGVVTSSVQKL
jgi:hypothetical protein